MKLKDNEIYSRSDAISYISKQIYKQINEQHLLKFIIQEKLNPCIYFEGNIRKLFDGDDYDFKQASVLGCESEDNTLYYNASQDIAFRGLVSPYQLSDRIKFFKIRGKEKFQITKLKIIQEEYTKCSRETLFSSINFESYKYKGICEILQAYNYNTYILKSSGESLQEFNVIVINVEEMDCFFLKKELDGLINLLLKDSNNNSINNYKDQLENIIYSLQEKILFLKKELLSTELNNTVKSCCNANHEFYAPELHNAILMWTELYSEAIPTGKSHSFLVNNWINNNLEKLINLESDNEKGRLKALTTPLISKNIKSVK